MTKLALLIGAKPRDGKVGPTVRFEKGNYIAQLENVTDSRIVLCYPSGASVTLINDTRMSLDSGDYHTFFARGGSEKYINAALLKV